MDNNFMNFMNMYPVNNNKCGILPSNNPYYCYQYSNNGGIGNNYNYHHKFNFPFPQYQQQQQYYHQTQQMPHHNNMNSGYDKINLMWNKRIYHNHNINNANANANTNANANSNANANANTNTNNCKRKFLIRTQYSSPVRNNNNNTMFGYNNDYMNKERGTEKQCKEGGSMCNSNSSSSSNNNTNNNCNNRRDNNYLVNNNGRENNLPQTNKLINGIKNIVNGILCPKLNCDYYFDHQRYYNPKSRNNYMKNTINQDPTVAITPTVTTTRTIPNIKNISMCGLNTGNNNNNTCIKGNNNNNNSNNSCSSSNSSNCSNSNTNKKKFQSSHRKCYKNNNNSNNYHRYHNKNMKQDDIKCSTSGQQNLLNENSSSLTIFTSDDFPELPIPKKSFNHQNDKKLHKNQYSDNSPSRKKYGKNFNKNKYQFNNDFMMKQKDLECTSEDGFVIVNQTNKLTSDDIETKTIESSSPSSTTSSTLLSSHSDIDILGNNKNKNRMRQLSECSDDSFVICFTDDAAEGVIELCNDINDDNKQNHFDLSDDNDDDDDDELKQITNTNINCFNKINDNSKKTDKKYCTTTTTKNNINKILPEYLTDNQPDSGFDEQHEKKVRFNLKPEIHVMHVWDYAYRSARKGNWENDAIDRLRFAHRIYNLENILNPILDNYHRDKIYRERFCDNN